MTFSSPLPDLPDFLADGVRFECTECGACCTGAPGKVRVSEEEIERISEYRKQDPDDFRRSETRIVGDERLLNEKENGDCVFFIDNRCSIHPVKPTQCRLYPFWFGNVRSKNSWDKTCAECPGIGEGPVVKPEDILRQVQEDLASR